MKPHRIVWSKGMFLTPQHFQTQDAFFDHALQFRVSASNFANWGVTNLSIDAESLANGLFDVHQARGVLPDGLAFSIPEGDEPPPGRQVADHFPPTQESLDVFLAVPERRPQGRNVTIPTAQSPGSNQATSRYVAETQIVPDEITVEEKPVQVAKINFRILFGDESLDGFTPLRIAQIMRNTAGAYVLNPNFVAPCLSIASSEYLMRLLRRQIEILAGRSSNLAATRRQKGKTLADFAPSDVRDYLLLHTINLFLPALKHIWKVRQGHPEALFLTMLQLAGALSTISLEIDSGDLPDYDHDNLGPCFAGLDDKVRALVETALPENCIPVPLLQADKFIWSGNVTDEQYFKNTQFFLAVSAAMGIDDLIREVPRRVKVSADSDIQRLVRNALPGITLRHTPTPPSAIRLKLDSQYFGLNQGGPLWEGIKRAHNVSVFAPAEIAQPKMELLIVLE